MRGFFFLDGSGFWTNKKYRILLGFWSGGFVFIVARRGMHGMRSFFSLFHLSLGEFSFFISHRSLTKAEPRDMIIRAGRRRNRNIYFLPCFGF